MQPFGLKRARARARRIIEDPQRAFRVIEQAIQKLQTHQASLKGVIDDLQLIFRLLKAWFRGEYKDISRESIVILVGAVIYFLMPIDAIIDVIPVLGLMDDIAVIGLAVAAVKNELDKFRQWENSKGPGPAAPGRQLPTT